MMEKSPVKIYILAGDDPTGAFKEEIARYKHLPNAVILRPMPHATLEQTLEQIRPPAHIIVDAHGVSENGQGNGSFLWHAHEDIRYDDLFKKVPAGTFSVGVSNCYGGIAQEYLSGLPAGVLLYSVTDSVPESSNTGTMVAMGLAQIKGIPNNAQLILSSWAAAPFGYEAEKKVAQQWLKDHPDAAKTNPEQFENVSENATMDLSRLLPDRIGIGGNPPIVVNLAEQAQRLSAQLQSRSVNGAEFNQAVAMVKEIYGKNMIPGIKATMENAPPNLAPLVKAINKEVDETAQLLKEGKPVDTDTPIAKAILNGLVVANLQTSGELDRLIGQAKGQQTDIHVGANIPDHVKAAARAVCTPGLLECQGEQAIHPSQLDRLRTQSGPTKN